MFRQRIAVCGITFFVLASATVAQPPGGQGRGGFGPFPGGPGGGPASPTALVGMTEVQKELALTDEQRSQVEQVIRETQEQMRASFGSINFQELATLSDEERQQIFDEARKKSDEAAGRADAMLGKLLDARQRARLNQLRLQRDGIAAFGRADVAKQLGLTDEQQAKMQRLDDSARSQVGGFGPPDFAAIEQQRQKALSDALAMLTDQQRAKWSELKGAEFKFHEPQFGFGPGGPGGPMGQERKIVQQFDKDGDGRLNADERQAARESLKSDRGPGRGGRGFGPPGGPAFGPPGGGGPGFRPPGFGRANAEPPKPGPRVAPSDPKSFPDAPLYEPTVLRTLFLNFENDNWEAELQDFHGTDVEVPATLTVDGKEYPNVGIHFRGMSSYMGVPAGYKRSLNLSVDFADEDQRLCGYKSLNLLNAHEDPSFMSSVLYSHIARQYMPAPKANFVKLVINGESWGVYANVQQFDKVFLAENFKTTKGARWKVSGNPGADGGLRYLGDNIDEYKRRFEIKSGDSEKSWRSLIALCRTLNETPTDELEAALEPMLDIDGVLWFLALDVALINNDGYWTRASDYSIFLDERGKFHIVPHDMNESFHGAMMFGPGGPGFGPGGPRGPGGGPPGNLGPGPSRPGERPRDSERRPGGGGIELDPLVGLTNARTPLRSRLLAVPNLRAKYLDHVRTIAEKSLDWKQLGPVVAQYRELIEEEVESDTRKLDSFESFQRVTSTDSAGPSNRGRELPLRSFAEGRRKFLLDFKSPSDDPTNSVRP